MPRLARIVLPGICHHVTQRGNNCQDVFFVDDDRRVYLELLRTQAEQYGFAVLGYCLMSNHVHVVGTPATSQSLAQALGRTHYLYTRYVNRLHERSGHLWQNRFFSCALDEVHLWRALCYVERNPVRARMVRVAWRYPWSSAAAHAGGADASGLLDLAGWRKLWKPGKWKEVLQQPEQEAEVERLLLCTHRGRPLATDSFLSKLEGKLGRRLRPLPVGRPKKSVAAPGRAEVRKRTRKTSKRRNG